MKWNNLYFFFFFKKVPYALSTSKTLRMVSQSSPLSVQTRLQTSYCTYMCMRFIAPQLISNETIREHLLLPSYASIQPVESQLHVFCLQNEIVHMHSPLRSWNESASCTSPRRWQGSHERIGRAARRATSKCSSS